MEGGFISRVPVELCTTTPVWHQSSSLTGTESCTYEKPLPVARWGAGAWPQAQATDQSSETPTHARDGCADVPQLLPRTLKCSHNLEI